MLCSLLFIKYPKRTEKHCYVETEFCTWSDMTHLFFLSHTLNAAFVEEVAELEVGVAGGQVLGEPLKRENKCLQPERKTTRVSK